MAVSQVIARRRKNVEKSRKPSLVNILSKEMASFIVDRYRKLQSFGGSTTPYTAHGGVLPPHFKMRIPVFCPDRKSYLENPEKFLPRMVPCLNDPSHRPHWHTAWTRELTVDHVHGETIPMFRGYCKGCKETISFWPEFVLPYQREPLETHESAVVDHLAGKSFVEAARETGYDPRTVARWVMRIIAQAFDIGPKIIARILKELPNSTLPVVPTAQLILVKVVLAWLREFAQWIGFPRMTRLIGLANLLGQGRWDIWGAPLGNAKPRPGG